MFAWIIIVTAAIGLAATAIVFETRGSAGWSEAGESRPAANASAEGVTSKIGGPASYAGAQPPGNPPDDVRSTMRGADERLLLQAQLEVERAKSAGLDRDLAAARANVAELSQRATAGDSHQMAARQMEDTLRDGQQRSAALADKQDEAQRGSTLQADLGRQLEASQAKGEGLDRDLKDTRDALNHTREELRAEYEMRRVVEAGGKASVAELEAEKGELRAEKERTATLSKKLADAELGYQAQIGMQQQLEAAKGKVKELEQALAGARTTLAQSGQRTSADQVARESVEADLKESEARTRIEQQRAESLSKTLADVQRAFKAQSEAETAKVTALDHDLMGARAQLSDTARSAQTEADEASKAQLTLRRQLEDEKVKTAAVDRDLAAARRQVADAAQEEVLLRDARHASEAASKDAVIKLQAEQGQTAVLAEKLAKAEQVARGQDDLRQQLEADGAQLRDLSQDLATARTQAAEAAKREQAAAGQSAERIDAQSAAQAVAEQQLASGLAEKLAEVDRAKAAQFDLGRQLEAARQALAEVAQRSAAYSSERQVAAARSEDALHAEKQKAVVPASSLAKAERASTEPLDLRRQIEAEKGKIAGQDRDGAAPRELADTAHEEALLRDERRPAEASAKDGAATLQSKQADSLTAGLQSIEAPQPSTEQLASRVQSATSVQSDTRSDAATIPGQAVPGTPDPLSQSASVGPTPQVAPATAPLETAGTGVSPPGAVVISAENVPLPDVAPARVLLRYARGNETARSRASALRVQLQARGLDVASPAVSSLADRSTSRVIYYYGEDRRAAERIANDSAMFGPVQSHVPVGKPLPPPGTIEVIVGGST